MRRKEPYGERTRDAEVSKTEIVVELRRVGAAIQGMHAPAPCCEQRHGQHKGGMKGQILTRKGTIQSMIPPGERRPKRPNT